MPPPFVRAVLSQAGVEPADDDVLVVWVGNADRDRAWGRPSLNRSKP